jgi:hypothetical protein
MTATASHYFKFLPGAKSWLLQWSATPIVTTSVVPAAMCCTALCNIYPICSELLSRSTRTLDLPYRPEAGPPT